MPARLSSEEVSTPPAGHTAATQPEAKGSAAASVEQHFRLPESTPKHMSDEGIFLWMNRCADVRDLKSALKHAVSAQK